MTPIDFLSLLPSHSWAAVYNILPSIARTVFNYFWSSDLSDRTLDVGNIPEIRFRESSYSPSITRERESKKRQKMILFFSGQVVI